MKDEIAHHVGQLDDALVRDFSRVILATISGHKAIYFIGNGGSAATASHMVLDLVQICQLLRPSPMLRALSLCSDPVLLTALANDYGYEHVFARQLRTLLIKGDLLIALSASGRSPNILRALKVARRAGTHTLGLTGRGGTAMVRLCDHVLWVDSVDPYVIEAVHSCFAHVLWKAISLSFGSKRKPAPATRNSRSRARG